MKLSSRRNPYFFGINMQIETIVDDLNAYGVSQSLFFWNKHANKVEKRFKSVLPLVVILIFLE